MKSLKDGFLYLFALLFLTSCVTAPNMQRINVSSGVSSQILNLQNSGNGGADTADRIMKSGFLNNGEEYGYYTLDMTSKSADYDAAFWPAVSGLSLMILPLLGLPIE